MNIRVTEKGSGEAARRLAELADRAADPRPAFDRTVDDLIVAERRRFAELGSTKASTRDAKLRDRDPRVQANAARAGVATGELERFMTTKGPRAQPAKLTKRELLFGVPARHRLRARAAMLAKAGRNPLVSSMVVRRSATVALRAYLTGNLRSARRWLR